MLSRKDQLVLAAERLFAQKGFAGTAIRDIAVAADMNVGSIYNFFSNKRDLHATVVEKAYRSLRAYVEGAQTIKGDPEGDLRRIMASAGRFFEEQPTMHRVILQEMMGGAKAMDRAIDLHLRSARARIVDILREGRRLGVFHAVDLEIFTYGLLSAMFGYFSNRALFLRLFPGRASEKKFIENAPFPIFEYVMKGLKCNPNASSARGRMMDAQWTT